MNTVSLSAISFELVFADGSPGEPGIRRRRRHSSSARSQLLDTSNRRDTRSALNPATQQRDLTSDVESTPVDRPNRAYIALIALVCLVSSCSGERPSAKSTATQRVAPNKRGVADGSRIVWGSVSGDGKGFIRSVYAVQDEDLPEPALGPYSLEFVDKQDNVLSRVSFQISSPDDGSSRAEGHTFAVSVPEPGPAASSLRIMQEGNEIGRQDSSKSPPRVDITSPVDGEALSDPNVSVTWKSSDRDGDGLSYLTRVKKLGENWQTVASGSQDSATADLGDYPVGTDATIQVIASDGFHSASSEVRITRS